jgi:hypothetical protein
MAALLVDDEEASRAVCPKTITWEVMAEDGASGGDNAAVAASAAAD